MVLPVDRQNANQLERRPLVPVPNYCLFSAILLCIWYVYDRIFPENIVVVSFMTKMLPLEKFMVPMMSNLGDIVLKVRWQWDCLPLQTSSVVMKL